MVDGQDATVLENEDVPFICTVNFEEGEGNSRQKGFFTQRSNYHYTPKQNNGILLPSYLIGAGFMFGMIIVECVFLSDLQEFRRFCMMHLMIHMFLFCLLEKNCR
jgi:hypothetical protein